MSWHLLVLIFSKLSLPETPLAFGLILGPVLEENLCRSLMMILLPVLKWIRAKAR